MRVCEYESKEDKLNNIIKLIFGNNSMSIMDAFNAINNLKPKYITPDTDITNFPNFAHKIFESPKITGKGCIDFSQKFVVPYMEEFLFRQLTDDCCLLFINGEYFGAFPSNYEAYNNSPKEFKTRNIFYTAFYENVKLAEPFFYKYFLKMKNFI